MWVIQDQVMRGTTKEVKGGSVWVNKSQSGQSRQVKRKAWPVQAMTRADSRHCQHKEWVRPAFSSSARSGGRIRCRISQP